MQNTEYFDQIDNFFLLSVVWPALIAVWPKYQLGMAHFVKQVLMILTTQFCSGITVCVDCI